jgi:hypothetical protein
MKTSKLEEKPPALKIEHRELESNKSRTYFHFFLFPCVIFAPDPADQNKCGSGYTTMPNGTGTIPYLLQTIQQGRNNKKGLT